MTKNVTDEAGCIHVLERSLGQGGQGTVWLVSGGRRVVKLLAKRGNREALRRQIAMVKRLRLDDLHVARPLALLRPPEVGYVAEFLEDMTSIGTLMTPPRKASIAEWYLATGGLRRRLRLLAHAGEALLGLHDRGLVYSDISHGNVFVSEPPDAHEAWLLDLDNLRHDSEPGRAVYTPGYGAPEVMDGSRGATSYSDAWSFAVLALRVLTLNHPFHGDMVQDGEPELEEKADAGELPWTGHRGDTSNASTRGIPLDWVLTKSLREAAEKTFEAGLRSPHERAPVSQWVKALHAAADITVRCLRCAGTFLALWERCSFCGERRPAIAYARIYRWHPARGIVRVGKAKQGDLERLPLTLEPIREPLTLLARHTHDEQGVAGRQAVALLTPVERGVHVRPLGPPLWITDPGAGAPSARPLSERGKTLLLAEDPGAGHVIHFEPPDTPHRVLVVNRGRQ